MLLRLIQQGTQTIQDKIFSHFEFIKEQTDRENLYKDTLNEENDQSLTDILQGSSLNTSKSALTSDLTLQEILESSSKNNKVLTEMLEKIEGGGSGTDIASAVALGGGAAKFGPAALGMLKAGGIAALIAATAAGGLDVGYGLGTAIFNPESIAKDKNNEDITFSDRVNVTLARMRHPFSDEEAFETYKWLSDPNKYEQEKLKQKYDAEYIKISEQFAAENKYNFDKNQRATGIQNDLTDIVNKVNKTGEKSLTDFERMVYSNLKRDESGNLVTDNTGRYTLDETKRSEITNWMTDSDNANKLSAEDISKYGRLSNFISDDNIDNQELIKSAIYDTKNQFTYTNEQDEDIEAKSIHGIKQDFKIDKTISKDELPTVLTDGFDTRLERAINSGDIKYIENQVIRLITEKNQWEAVNEALENDPNNSTLIEPAVTAFELAATMGPYNSPDPATMKLVGKYIVKDVKGSTNYIKGKLVNKNIAKRNINMLSEYIKTVKRNFNKKESKYGGC